MDSGQPARGPLTGLRFVEIAGIGPAPLVCMVLADLGATGIRIDSPRPGLSMGDPARDITRRGRPSITLDLRSPDDREQALRLIASADVLVEGLRPGAMERLALGPEDCHVVNPALVFARMTGWGQQGPYARVAGHDLTYLAAAGVLAHIGRRGQPPTPPLNLVADYGGGAMFCLVGLLAALWETQRSGLGQVVDAAMIDGAAVIMSLFHAMRNQGLWSAERGVNILDSGAPFYDVYRTADDGWLAVACLEPAFYAEWLHISGLTDSDLPAQYDITGWPRLREAFAQVIATRTRDEWAELVHGTDACAEVVLTMDEAASHPQLAARATLIDVEGHSGDIQASPAPRFSRTPGRIRTVTEVNDILAEWGLS